MHSGTPVGDITHGRAITHPAISPGAMERSQRGKLMLLSSMTQDADFASFVLETIPDIARLPAVQAALEKYTSGYLNKARLTAIMTTVSYPLVQMEPIGGGTAGWNVRNTICIDTHYFQFYKKLIGSYPILVPATFFHELAHWGCWKNQQEGHASDRYGREHDSHDGFESPLDVEVMRVLRAQRMFVPAPTRPTRRAA